MVSITFATIIANYAVNMVRICRKMRKTEGADTRSVDRGSKNVNEINVVPCVPCVYREYFAKVVHTKSLIRKYLMVIYGVCSMCSMF